MKSLGILNGENIENKIKSQDLFENIKSKYIIIKLFDNLSKKKFLDIIKYNNKIKRRIDININDYKEYLEIYSSIEIEIVPVENKYDKFINIDEENMKYYHIYFDNGKEEIKRNYLNENENIKKIEIKIDYQVNSFKDLFFNCNLLKL